MDRVINMAKDLARISELKLKIVEKEATRESLMTKLGKEVYGAYPAINLASISEIVEEAHKLDEEVSTLNDAIIAIKGLHKCPECGALVKDDMKFCGQCGARIKEDVPPEEPQDAPEPEETAEDVPPEE